MIRRLTRRPLNIEGALIEVNPRGGWQAANETSCPPHIQAQIRSHIRDHGINACDGYTASNRIEYRWYPAPLPRLPDRRNYLIAVAVAIGVALGFGLGTGARCFEAWREGGTADPRCVFWQQTGYVEVHRYSVGAEQISCEYRPEVWLSVGR